MYPIWLNLQGKSCLVIGAGHVAQRRVQALLEAGALVTAAAPEEMPAVWAGESRLTYCQCRYDKTLLKGQQLVFAATDDPAQNGQIVKDAQAQGIWASSVTVCEDAVPDFSVPASRSAGEVSLAVSTDGSVPALSAAMCREMEPVLDSYAKLCDCLKHLRTIWKETVPEESRRAELLRQMTAPKALALFREQGSAAYAAYGNALAGNPSPAEKSAILVVSFGTSYAETREKTIGAVERAIAEAFPQADVFRAFTSGMILRKLRREGVAIDSVPEALRRLKALGYTHVYCQPTHLIPGEEYDDLRRDAAAFQGDFTVLKIGMPLLGETDDYPALVRALAGELTVSDTTAYVLMGHGTTHAANPAYPAFDYWLKRMGYANVFVGTVEGYPTLETVLEQLQAGSWKRVVLLPMMLVAGDHAQNDMAGEEESSWRSVLTRKGYEVTVRMQGLGELPGVQAMYTAHAAQMIRL